MVVDLESGWTTVSVVERDRFPLLCGLAVVCFFRLGAIFCNETTKIKLDYSEKLL